MIPMYDHAVALYMMVEAYTCKNGKCGHKYHIQLWQHCNTMLIFTMWLHSLSSSTVGVTGLLLVLFASFLDICHIHCFTTLTKDGYLLYPCCVLITLIAGNENAKGIELLEFSKPGHQERAAVQNSLAMRCYAWQQNQKVWETLTGQIVWTWTVAYSYLHRTVYMPITPNIYQRSRACRTAILSMSPPCCYASICPASAL